ncbi:GNAT family N-acetyltransferase [Phormidesmis priestleyi]|uniref:GNAT family N-acetyltransferase n=1 Tax=Phormidesmis priestleyi TaxID=268141 RepID=UPI000AB5D3B6|nr:GNAT family N-acetyltransferase [Phormidesmis priestleyi]
MSALIKQSFRTRSYAGEADLQAIVDLINACDAVDHLDQETSVEELRLEFADPDFEAARDLRLWEDAQGRLTGYGWMWVPSATDVQDGFLGFKVHPDVRGQGIEDQILAWAEEWTRKIGLTTPRSVKLRSGVRESQVSRIALLEKSGFTITRSFYRMARSMTEPLITPQLPNGYTVRSLHETETEAWVEMFNQTFIDHWDFHPLTIEQRQYWMKNPDYAADL